MEFTQEAMVKFPRKLILTAIGKNMKLVCLLLLPCFVHAEYLLHDPHEGTRQKSTIPEVNVDWEEVQKEPVYLNGKPADLAGVETMGATLDSALSALGAQGVRGKRHPYLCHLALESVRYHLHLRRTRNIPRRNADIDHPYWYSRRQPAILAAGGISPLEDVGLVSGGSADSVVRQIAQMWRNSAGHYKTVFPRKQNHCSILAQGPDGAWYGIVITSDGALKQSRLGVEYQQEDSGNARITAVYPGSFAAQKGWQVGDTILGIDDEVLTPKIKLPGLLPRVRAFTVSFRKRGTNHPVKIPVPPSN